MVCWWARWFAGGLGGLLVGQVVYWWARWFAGELGGLLVS